MQIKIEPFKHPLATDPSYPGKMQPCCSIHACCFPSSGDADTIPRCMHCDTAADKTWKILEDAIHQIHNQNASGLSFEELYRCVAWLCRCNTQALREHTLLAQQAGL